MIKQKKNVKNDKPTLRLMLGESKQKTKARPGVGSSFQPRGAPEKCAVWAIWCSLITKRSNNINNENNKTTLFNSG